MIFKITLAAILIAACLPTLSFLFIFFISTYAVVDCELNVKKKNNTPPVKKGVINNEVTAPEENGDSGVSEEEDESKKEETTEGPDQMARKWIEDNADLIVELTKPTYKNMKFEIKSEKLKGIDSKTKDAIVLMLMEIYPREINRCGVTKTGSIAGEITN